MFIEHIDFYCSSLTGRKKLYVEASIRFVNTNTVPKVNDDFKINDTIYKVVEVINQNKTGFFNLKLL